MHCSFPSIHSLLCKPLDTTIKNCKVSTSSFFLYTDSSSTKETALPQWAIIVIAVMSGLVVLTGLVVLLVFSFTWFNRARYSLYTFSIIIIILYYIIMYY